MQNPSSADHSKGVGRQVPFIIENKGLPNYTDWMKHRVESLKGKEIYSHCMIVVEPGFGNMGGWLNHLQIDLILRKLFRIKSI